MNASRLRSILTKSPAIATTDVFIELPDGTFAQVEGYRFHTEHLEPGQPMRSVIVLETTKVTAQP